MVQIVAFTGLLGVNYANEPSEEVEPNMLNHPTVLYGLIAVLIVAGCYVIYLVVRPKQKASPKQVRHAKDADMASEVDKALRAANMPAPGGDFRVGRDHTAEESVDGDALLTAEAMSKRLEQDTERKRNG